MTASAPTNNARKFRIFVTTCIVIGLLLRFCMPSFGQAPGKGVKAAPNEILIGLKNANAASIQSIASEKSIGKVLGQIPQLGVLRVKSAPGFTTLQAVDKLLARSDVAYVEPNYVLKTFATPNDPYYGYQWAPAKVQADTAWQNWKPRAQVIIAIVDTGIDYNHPDLTNKILRSNGSIVGYNATGANDRSGSSTDPIDDHGHGTHCAGIAAAQANNGTGVAGIAGWNGSPGSSDTSFIKLMPVKTLSSTGSGYLSWVADGITWAADHGAKVISLSLGAPTDSYTLDNAIAYAWGKGCIITAAAGNDGVSDKSYPGACPYALSVAATDSSDGLTYFSNYGSWVKCAAPGYQIYSTLPTVSTPAKFPTNYGSLSGTSMATPLVAGEAALLMSQNPSLSNSQVFDIITHNVDSYDPYYSDGYIGAGAGRVNVNRALQAATPKPVAPGGCDFNGDGMPDCVAFNASTGEIAVLLMNGTKVMDSYSLTPSLPKGWTFGATGDFLSNGTTSLAVQNLATQQISILGISGKKIVSSIPLTPSMLPNWKIVCAGDFNGDGQPDLVAQNTITREISILTINNLKITGSIPVHPTLPAGWQVCAAGDFDGNGTTDLLVQNASTSQISILYMNGTSITASVAVTPNLPTGWTVVGMATLTGGANPDVIVQNNATGQTSALSISNGKFTASTPMSPNMAAGWVIAGPR